MIIGVISDTHGLVRPEALAALAGSDLIFHAGDVGSLDVLDTLRAIAPVIAVRGNNDKGPWAEGLPEIEVAQVEAAMIYLLHDIGRLDLDPVAAGMKAVITGHSHKPSVRTERGVLYLNPGSAGPRRFILPVTVARMRVLGPDVTAEVVVLDLNS